MSEKRHTILGAREKGITRAVTYAEGAGYRWMLCTRSARFADGIDYPTREEARGAMVAAVQS